MVKLFQVAALDSVTSVGEQEGAELIQFLSMIPFRNIIILIKFGYAEKATKFEKIFHLKFDITE